MQENGIIKDHNTDPAVRRIGFGLRPTLLERQHTSPALFLVPPSDMLKNRGFDLTGLSH